MKNLLPSLAVGCVLLLALSGCGADSDSPQLDRPDPQTQIETPTAPTDLQEPQEPHDENPDSAAQQSDGPIAAPNLTEAQTGLSTPPVPPPEPSVDRPSAAKPEQPPDTTEEAAIPPRLTASIDDLTFIIRLADTPAAQEFLERLPMTLSMNELNGNEKFFYLSEPLSPHAEQPEQIHAGDLMLYGSDCLVLFYESFSSDYSYTRLGVITDPTGLAEALGQGSTEVVFQLAPLKKQSHDTDVSCDSACQKTL